MVVVLLNLVYEPRQERFGGRQVDSFRRHWGGWVFRRRPRDFTQWDVPAGDVTCGRKSNS